MSDMPHGWAGTTIGEICDLVNGKAFKPSDWSASGLPIVRIQNLNRPDNKFNHFDGTVDERFLIEDGDLLFAWSGTPGTSFGAHIWNGPKAVLNQHIFNVRFDRNAFDRNFLRHAINQTLDEQIAKAHGGVGLRHVTKGKFEETEVPIPPLPEQRRIVAKIDSLTGKSRRARDHLDHIPRLVEKYKQAILAAAFRGDLTREWREGRSLAATRSVLLGEVAEGFNYGSAAKSAKQGRVPVLRMGNIQDGKLDWTDLVFTDDAAEIAKYRLKNGDVLFNRTNSPALVGKTALFTGKREAIYAGYLIKVRCKPQLLPAFLTYCLNAPNGRAYSWEVKTDGVSQSNINAKKLAAFRFDLPSVQEQEEIVRRIERALSWINRVTVDATSARKLIDHLDNSVLAKAFRGELVPQDPADEPASALLDRIREERAAAPKAKRGRKKAA